MPIRKVDDVFLFADDAPFASCHASTIAATPQGLVAAFFAGSAEGNDDVTIWVARHDGTGWLPPAEVAVGAMPVGARYPCWNPVLFQRADGPLLLFYKVGPTPARWWGMLTTSDDGGASWSVPQRLPEGILGPIKNKPEWIDGALLCPSSDEADSWSIHLERTTDLVHWERIGPLNDGHAIAAIQPSILRHRDGALQLICRTRQGFLATTWSDDAGATWSPLALTGIPNPNSGTDAVTLADGRHLLVYNPRAIPQGRWGGPRNPLTVALSDDGRTWHNVLTLAHGPGEFSYPAVIQAPDGKVHITYTWQRRRIKYVRCEA